MANTQRLIDVARQDVQLQQKELDRQKALPQGFASNAEIDQANRALLAATQQLVSVENQLDLLRKRRVRLEASERLAATQLRAAEVNLKRTEIRAPIEGVIVSEDADLNTFVARGNPLVTIEDTSKVEVATNLRMDQLYWVLDQQGEKLDPAARGYNLPETPAIIEYELAGRDDALYRWKGRLLRYDGIGLDPVTRTVPVRVVVDDPTASIDQDGQSKTVGGATALVRGMFVRVKLLIQPQTPLVVIPARALQPGNRVLQFVPDESVLSSASGKEPAEDAAAVRQTSGGSFDPDAWEPGRVFLRRAVNPVDSLSIGQLGGSVSESAFASSGRLWVCEARDPALQGGSFVVVSPLGDIADEALPVRAERKGMESSGRPPSDQSPTRSAAARDLDAVSDLGVAAGDAS
jgi:multidrug efflux pump subunit AcrA (membrane-fusion protein)